MQPRNPGREVTGGQAAVGGAVFAAFVLAQCVQNALLWGPAAPNLDQIVWTSRAGTCHERKPKPLRPCKVARAQLPQLGRSSPRHPQQLPVASAAWCAPWLACTLCWLCTPPGPPLFECCTIP